MIRQIQLEHFKCFEELRLPFKRLTLLTGFNASGKSSTTQSLLLLAQTARVDPIFTELAPNGPLVALGSPGEIINRRSNSESLFIAVQGENFGWGQRFFAAGEAPRRHLTTQTESTLAQKVERYADANNLRRLLSDLIYVGATRQTDRHLYPTGDNTLSKADCGSTGEYAPWLFYLHGDDSADAKLSIESNDDTGTIRKQVNGWMRGLFTGAEANVSLIQEADRMKLEFRTSEIGAWQRPANVGYGLSYAFPLLVAGILSSPDQTLIIDSPEAHLHPMGQSLMGRFSAQVASTGRQMLVETHSDHFLNGVRLSLRNGLISPEDVVVYFFKQGNGVPNITELVLDRYGNVSSWPEGFFDQAEQDLASLSGWN